MRAIQSCQANFSRSQYIPVAVAFVVALVVALAKNVGLLVNLLIISFLVLRITLKKLLKNTYKMIQIYALNFSLKKLCLILFYV